MKKLTIKKTAKSFTKDASSLSRLTLKNFKGGIIKLDPISGECPTDSICVSGRAIWNNFSGKPHTDCCS